MLINKGFVSGCPGDALAPPARGLDPAREPKVMGRWAGGCKIHVGEVSRHRTAHCYSWHVASTKLDQARKRGMFKSGEGNAEKTTTLLGVTILANLQHGMLPCLHVCLHTRIAQKIDPNLELLGAASKVQWNTCKY